MSGAHAEVVLVVEDDRDTREALSELLGDAGYSVVAAADGREAIEALGRLSGPPCVILLDLMMPRMNGWQFMTWLSGQPQHREVPVVLLSAAADLAAHARALAAADYLPKPLDIGRALAVVGSHCPGS